MTCDEVRQWLDDGRPQRPRMAEHVAACDACAREFRAALEIEAMLAVVVPVEADFHDAVMERVRRRGAWIDVIAQPVVPVSLAIVVVIPELARVVESVQWTMGVAGALAAVTLTASWQLFRMFRRMTLPDV